MTKAEVARLLARAAAFDSRRVSQAMVESWWLVLGDLGFGEAEAALVEHFRSSREYLMPVHIREGVMSVREVAAWDVPELGRVEARVCALAGMAPEEFVALDASARRDMVARYRPGIEAGS